MMFGGEDQTLHPGRFGGKRDLFGVEIGWVEQLLALVAIPPFFVRKCINREVDKAVKLHLVPAKLTLGRGGAERRRSGDRRRQCARS